jgi:hypothetical protein
VQQMNREFKMVFSEGEPEIQQEEAGKTNITLNLVYVPNALFAELGIIVTKVAS